MACSVCQTATYALLDGTTTCTDCATKLGLRALPPSRRPRIPCVRCNHREFVRVVPRELTSSPGEYGSREAVPFQATYAPDARDKLIFSGRKVLSPEGDTGFGVMEMVICRGCGFTEWYCQDPDRIPVGTEYNTVLDTIGTGAPHR